MDLLFIFGRILGFLGRMVSLQFQKILVVFKKISKWQILLKLLPKLGIVVAWLELWTSHPLRLSYKLSSPFYQDLINLYGLWILVELLGEILN